MSCVYELILRVLCLLKIYFCCSEHTNTLLRCVIYVHYTGRFVYFLSTHTADINNYPDRTTDDYINNAVHTLTSLFDIRYCELDCFFLFHLLELCLHIRQSCWLLVLFNSPFSAVVQQPAAAGSCQHVAAFAQLQQFLRTNRCHPLLWSPTV